MDDYSSDHTLKRIFEPDERGVMRVTEEQRQRVVNKIKQMLTMNAPAEAVGVYSWRVEVNDNKGELVARVIVFGNMIKTVVTKTENYPANTVLYKIKKDKTGGSDEFVKA
jgi:hypothetical protein